MVGRAEKALFGSVEKGQTDRYNRQADNETQPVEM